MGLIKKLLGGIFGLLSGILKIFGIGRSGYYAEIDDLKPADPTPVNQSKSEAAQAKGVQADQANAIKKPAKVEVEQAVNRLEPNPVTTKAPAAPKPDTSQPSDTFAPRFLVPNGRGGRRRPGPSLSGFKDLAREVNPSLRG